MRDNQSIHLKPNLVLAKVEHKQDVKCTEKPL
jgi:hypothetical protein